jgi:hypothetical protein
LLVHKESTWLNIITVFDTPVIYVNLVIKLFTMTKIVIDKKKYVLLLQKDYEVLQKKAALKVKPTKTFTVEEARIQSKKLIRKWAAEK